LQFKFEYAPQGTAGGLDAVGDYTYNIAENKAE
jgi:hypothetical protein